MFLEIFGSSAPSLTVTVKDPKTLDVIKTYVFGVDKELSLSNGKFYLNFNPTAALLLFEITDGVSTTSKLLPFRVEAFPTTKNQQSVYLNWSSSVASNYDTLYHNATYNVYYQKKDVTECNKDYTTTDNTIHYVDFTDLTSGYYRDSNDVNVFLDADTIQASTDTGKFVGSYCATAAGSLSGSFNIDASFGLTGSFWVFSDTIIDYGFLKFEFDTGTIAITLTDKFGKQISYTPVYTLSGGWYAVSWTFTDSRFVALVDDKVVYEVVFTSTYSFENVSITSISITGGDIGYFVLESYARPLYQMFDFMLDNKPVFIGSTQALDYMFDASEAPVNPQEYEFIVTYVSNEYVSEAETVLETVDCVDVEVRSGKWCYVWDVYNLDYVPTYGVTFEASYKDRVASEYLPKVDASINSNGFMGVYLPVGSIYTATFWDRRPEKRFIVPDSGAVKLGTL